MANGLTNHSFSTSINNYTLSSKEKDMAKEGSLATQQGVTDGQGTGASYHSKAAVVPLVK
jgi:hypothetical protein